MEEWDIYNQNIKKTGKIGIRGKYQFLPNEYHLVVHVWLLTKDGKILLTQRAKTKKIAPMKWECTAGSIIKGETTEEGALRELKEETGLLLEKQDLHLFRKEKRDHYNDIFFAYYAIVGEEIINQMKFEDGEVINKKWVTLDQFKEMLENKETVQNIYYIKEEYNRIIVKKLTNIVK